VEGIDSGKQIRLYRGAIAERRLQVGLATFNRSGGMSVTGRGQSVAESMVIVSSGRTAGIKDRLGKDRSSRHSRRSIAGAGFAAPPGARIHRSP